jgi:hypothetical protein
MTASPGITSCGRVSEGSSQNSQWHRPDAADRGALSGFAGALWALGGQWPTGSTAEGRRLLEHKPVVRFGRMCIDPESGALSHASSMNTGSGRSTGPFTANVTRWSGSLTGAGNFAGSRRGTRSGRPTIKPYGSSRSSCHSWALQPRPRWLVGGGRACDDG